jgi:predicted DNA-binding transcriptional regulator
MNNKPQLILDDNPEMAMADAFVRHTGSNIFLTGKAGTGKTTFLTELKADCHKQIVVTAPTGVAAINAGGVTLHSFFQLPFGPYIPGRKTLDRDSRRFFRFSKEKKRIIKGLDLLIIDEISMVRADLLDSVDALLRRLRRDDRPFGGVQLLLIGDLFQLPPVAKPEEWQVLQDYYSSIYFFASHALARVEMVTIELKKIYRQSDRKFIDLLNQVRENRLDDEAAALLDRCAKKTLPDQGAIILTTHNRKADDINREHLERLDGSPHELTAEVEGEFPEQFFPTPDRLILKKGAQVMFLRNDTSPEKLYYNGKIGRVSEVRTDRVLVTDTEGQADPVEVKPVEWENITYKINAEDQTIEEKVIGRFSQIPLKPAWAVTIHKSQGLTFDRAVVDARDAFAHGQTYVALSRCRSLDGLVLSSPVPRTGIAVDPSVAEFMASATAGSDIDYDRRFHAARSAYQQELLLQCFDFNAMRGMFYYFMRLADTHSGSVRVAGLSDIARLKNDARDQIFEVGDKFGNQLRGMMADNTLPDDDEGIRERTRKASAWFEEKFFALFSDLTEKGHVETDNKALKKQMTNGLDNLCLEIRVRLAGIRSCADGFSSKTYLRAISGEGMAAPSTAKKAGTDTRDYTELDIDHPEMFKTLKEWRAEVAGKLGVPHFHVLHQKVLVQIAVCLPEDETALSRLKGVGPKTREKYAEDILCLVKEYRKKHNIETVILPEPKPAETSPDAGKKKKRSNADTREISLTLFEQGMDIRAIADERGLATSTVESHLCHFIEKGVLNVDRLVAQNKQKTIEAVLRPGKPMRELKDELGSNVSYGEIRAVIAHQKFKEPD